VGQARPILVGQCASMAFAVVDTVLSGHASSVDLATMGLGLSVYSTVFVGLMGATSALNPIVAQHFGGGRLAAIGATYVQGLWMALFLSALGVVPLLCGGLWLPWLQAPAEVETQVARYLRVLAVALPGALMFRAIYAVNTALSRPHVVRTLTLLPYLAAFHFFDALQVMASFVLRAYRRAIAPTVIHAVALWGLGVIGGYLVAFGGLGGPPWGIAGMWLMQSFALALAALLLVGFYLGLPRLRRSPA
jgi:multidrug resistance protein, MATE family